MPAGRPKFKWTDEIKSKLIDGIISGQAIRNILKELGISEPTFYRHRLDDPEFDSIIARAQEMTQEREVDEMLRIADSAKEDNANAMKLRIWTRMWIAGKRKPKKYGDKVENVHSGSVGVTLQHSVPRPERTKE